MDVKAVTDCYPNWQNYLHRPRTPRGTAARRSGRVSGRSWFHSVLLTSLLLETEGLQNTQVAQEHKEPTAGGRRTEGGQRQQHLTGRSCRDGASTPFTTSSPKPPEHCSNGAREEPENGAKLNIAYKAETSDGPQMGPSRGSLSRQLAQNLRQRRPNTQTCISRSDGEHQPRR